MRQPRQSDNFTWPQNRRGLSGATARRVMFGTDVVAGPKETKFVRVPKGMVLSDLQIRDVTSGDIKIKVTTTQDPVWRAPTDRDKETGLLEITKEFPSPSYPGGTSMYTWYDGEWGAFTTILVYNDSSYSDGGCWVGGTWTATPSHP